jgi:hypothetical protein
MRCQYTKCPGEFFRHLSGLLVYYVMLIGFITSYDLYPDAMMLSVMQIFLVSLAKMKIFYIIRF